ncbi:MAG: type 2 lantipeptide synthetase LanM [Ardenticatenales bacterium]|nr:type 2 lantipeptide synthetase LanM [Ardenticatenales bacterium]
MSFSPEELVALVTQATLLQERLGGPGVVVNGPEQDARVQAALDQWVQLVAKADQADFEKRLAWDGLTLDSVRAALLSAPARVDSIPGWATLLSDAVHLARSLLGSTLEDELPILPLYADPEHALPYQDVFIPFVEVARQRVLAGAGATYDLLSEVAHAGLERGLLERLTELSARCLELEFSIARLAHRNRPASGNLSGWRTTEPSRFRYQSFVRNLYQGGLARLLKEYAALARLIGTVMELWIETTREFLHRLDADQVALTQGFQLDPPAYPLFPIQELKSNLSDFHHRGRTVLQITFASGTKVIYKPKDVGLEEAFYQLIDWMNHQSLRLPLRTFAVLNRGRYGWVEYVPHRPCQSEEEVHRYYQRAGMLLALLYALEATDNHHENIIACGEHPVLIDMEALMHQRTSREVRLDAGNTEAQTHAAELLNQSVLRTGFLPIWNFRADGQSFDGSGLSATPGQETGVRVARWDQVNTDQMALQTEYYRLEHAANLPTLNGQPVSLADYIDSLVVGFQEVYECLMTNNAVLLGESTPLEPLFAQSVRFIFRNTGRYFKTLENALLPKFLRNGIDRSIVLDAVNAPLVEADATRPMGWPLTEIERQALEIHDIPIFTLAATSEVLDDTTSEGQIHYFDRPVAALVRERLASLSHEDMEQQIAFIRASLYSRVMRPAGSGDWYYAAAELNNTVSLSADELVAEAETIAEGLQQRAIRSRDGSLSWIALGYVLYAKRYRLQPMDYDLYNGSGGIAFFFAALAHITKQPRYHEMCLGTLKLLRHHLYEPTVHDRLAERIGLGIATGLGSLVYTLARCASFLNDPKLLDDALQAARLITSERIEADEHFDLARGTAGAILALLTLHQQARSPELLEQARLCGEHLLRRRSPTETGHQAWALSDGKCLTGFLHGAAGIAYALFCLHDETDEVAFYEAAQEALAYERALFVPEINNWLPYAGAPTKAIMTTWCHGAPGIGLARLANWPKRADETTREEIECALTSTQELGLRGIDHLCCGNFGRMELLTVAGQQLSEPTWHDMARRWASQLVRRKQEQGNYLFSPDIPADIYQPGLFTGNAGIGYALLRVAYPDQLPSLLLWN